VIVKQSGSFKRAVKKMHKAEKVGLDAAVKKIIENPDVGDTKVGDLAGIQVFKYKHNAQLYLLAYEYLEAEIILTLIKQGTHENFIVT
jgi:mRNA-degrading endonuclease YafQ of YafQ-DinJ toxin-antitoxin module